MRLIDADDFYQRIKYDTDICAEMESDGEMALKKYIDLQPTAYDVDEVVTKLENLKSGVPVNRLLDDVIKDKPKELGQLIAYDKTIKIVKDGGIMARVTKRIKRVDKDDLIVYTKGKYEDTISAEMTKDDIRVALKKLAEYEDLEEQGMLIKIPYALGKVDILYFLDERRCYIYKLNASEIELRVTQSGKAIYTIDYEEFCFEDFGKTVFLTESEAEAKLKELTERIEGDMNDN